VVAETTGQGQRDATTNRVLGGVELVEVGEPLARVAGVLRYRSGVSGTVDALVVATAAAQAALEGGAVVLTADIDDMNRLSASRSNGGDRSGSTAPCLAFRPPRRA